MSDVGDRIEEAMSTVMTDDFSVYVQALCECIREVDDLVRDSDAGTGWSSILDLQRIPVEGLPWLAQWIGVAAITGLSEQQQRDRIAAHANWKRGSVGAIIASAQLHLTGNKTVILRERFGGSAWQLVIITNTSETPDAAQTLRDILEQKPAGIVLTYNVLDGQDFQQLLTDHPTFQNVFADYATFENVLEDT